MISGLRARTGATSADPEQVQTTPDRARGNERTHRLAGPARHRFRRRFTAADLDGTRAPRARDIADGPSALPNPDRPEAFEAHVNSFRMGPDETLDGATSG